MSLNNLMMSGGSRNRLDAPSKSRDLPGGRILVHDALLCTAHDFRLRGLQGRTCRALIAAGNGFFHLADERTNPRAAVGIDLGAPGDVPDGFLCRTSIGHVSLDPGYAAIPGAILKL